MAMSEFEKARRDHERELEKARRLAVAREKEQKRQQRDEYLASRKAEAAGVQVALEVRTSLLQSFLIDGLSETSHVSVSRLHRTAKIPQLNLGDLGKARPAPEWQRFAPAPPGFWKRSFAQASVADELNQAKAKFEAATVDHDVAEAERLRRVEARRSEYAQAARQTETALAQYNDGLDALARRADDRDKAAVDEYLLKMISLVPLPEDFPRESQAAFDPKTEHAVVETELPGPECVPVIKAVRYVQARDEITETVRPAREKGELYRGVVAQLCLLLVRTLFNSDPHLKQISFNGRVRHINPATGHEERPHIISVVVAREQFESLVLDRVKPDECLRHLHALVSRHPAELEAVEPLIDFDKSRLAFIEGLGAISDLDSRPDLMSMSPTRFEHLINELLEADPSIESVESLTTRQSNDGGVDGVVYIKQPFGRSMTVVQAKQYARNRHLGPAHIRELIGAMHEVKAGNGLLVTTSDFTPIARANAAEFGRISLIDGNNLVYMIKNLLGKDVLISKRRT